jgi:hypothetical protein
VLGPFRLDLAPGGDVPGDHHGQGVEHVTHSPAAMAGRDDQRRRDPVTRRVVDLRGERPQCGLGAGARVEPGGQGGHRLLDGRGRRAGAGLERLLQAAAGGEHVAQTPGPLLQALELRGPLLLLAGREYPGQEHHAQRGGQARHRPPRDREHGQAHGQGEHGAAG